jgi:CobQ-like glutamine amidotransferase family enzyme
MRDSTVDIGLVLPDLLGTYGDGGNAEVLACRLRWRGIPARVLPLYVVGGGEDAAQELAARYLSGLADASERGAVVLAICAGLQLLGQRFTGLDGRSSAGLGLLDVYTDAAPRRAIGEIVTEPCVPGLDEPLTGFENHQGHTTLGARARPLGRVTRGTGNGDGTDGVVQGRIVGTYLHGPVLARNPQLADLLLTHALGQELAPLELPSVAALRRQRLTAQLSRPAGRRHR